MGMKVTVIADYICPGSYIASRQVADLEQEFDIDVAWSPFELHPGTPKAGLDISPAGTANDGGIEEHLRSFARQAGLTLATNRRLANSHRALELAEFARDRGCFRPVHEALFRACFETGENIGDSAVLGRIATECGLDVEEFSFECLIGRYAELVDRTTELAREGGFVSTPVVVIDDQVSLTGVHAHEAYAEALERLGARLRHPGII